MANVIYSNARAKALENNLLGYERLDRMVESATVEDALKILSEVNFGEGISVNSAMDFEKILAFEEEKLFNFIKTTCASESFKKFVLYKNDFYNAEAFIKAKYLKLNVEDMTFPDGLIPKSKLQEKIMVDEYKDFPASLANACLTCDAEFVSGKATGVFVDSVFKTALYGELYALSKKDKHLSNIYKVKADSANIAVSLRTRNYNEAKKYYVQGGSINNTELKSLCEDSLEVLKDKCKYFSSNGDLAITAVDDKLNGKPLSDFEKKSEDYALTYLKKNKYETTGIIPFMLYTYYKLSEIQNVRLIIVGLINKTPKADIKRRLRDTYEK